MLIKSKEKLNAYINEKSNQLFYTALPYSGNVSLNVGTVGTSFPYSKYRRKMDLVSPHAKFYKFEYVLEGKGYLECDGNEYELEKGTLVYVRSNVEFEMYSDKENPMKKHFLNVNGKFVEGILSVRGISSALIVVKADVNEEFENIMKIFDGADGMNLNLLYKVEVEMLKITQKLEKAVNSKELSHITKAENIISYIEQNLTTKLAIEDILSAFFISKTHLIRIFKEKYKITPMKYVLTRKIDLAKYYLRETEMSVMEISSLLCFSDSKYFSKVFKKQVRMTPVEYRKKEFFEIEELQKKAY